MTEKLEKKENVKVSGSNQDVVVGKKLNELSKEEMKKFPLLSIEYRRIFNKKTKKYTRYEAEILVNPRLNLVINVTAARFNKLALLYNIDINQDIIKLNAACRFCQGTFVDKNGIEHEYKMIQAVVKYFNQDNFISEAFYLNEEDKDIFEILLQQKKLSYEVVQLSKEESDIYSAVFAEADEDK